MNNTKEMDLYFLSCVFGEITLYMYLPVEVFNVFLRDCDSLSLQHLSSEFSQMITFTANQLFG